MKESILKGLALSFVAATGFVLTAEDVGAQSGRACNDRAKVVQRLEERYGETLKSLGLQGDNGVVEIYASEETGTWTILITHANGQSCLLAAGQRWEENVDQLAPKGPIY